MLLKYYNLCFRRAGKNRYREYFFCDVNNIYLENAFRTTPFEAIWLNIKESNVIYSICKRRSALHKCFGSLNYVVIWIYILLHFCLTITLTQTLMNDFKFSTRLPDITMKQLYSQHRVCCRLTWRTSFVVLVENLKASSYMLQEQ